MINFFADIFGYILNWIYLLVQNYGFAIIIFSVLIKLVMPPPQVRHLLAFTTIYITQPLHIS